MAGGTDREDAGGPDREVDADDAEVVLRLPDELRVEFKDPLGPVYADPETLVDLAGRPLISVGDVVTYHLETAGRIPEVALLDGYTERERIGDGIRAALGEIEPEVLNPPATLTAELLSALRDALGAPGTARIVVDGEEDLATLPAVLAAPDGASVVYGQPGEGMVLVTVDADTRSRCRDLVARMEGDHERFDALLGVEGER